VTVPRDNPDAVSANLKAPLLYFQDDATLHQVVLERADWPLRFPLLQPQERSGNPADEPRSSDETGEVD
jgi:flagellar assembly factor FliW